MSGLRRMLPAVAQGVVLAGACSVMIAGFAKMLDPGAFIAALIAHDLVPEAVGSNLGWGVILVELWAAANAVWALLRARPAIAAWSIAAIFGVFAWYAAALVVFPPPEPVGCGCGLLSDDAAHWPSLTLRNTAASGLFCLCALISRRPAPSPRSPH